MMTIAKTVSMLVTGSFLIFQTPVSQAGNFSISIGYSNFGYHSGHLPYSYKPFSHPRAIYYSPLRPHYHSYPAYNYYRYTPGYTINYFYFDKPYYYGDRKHYRHKKHHEHKHYDRGHNRHFYYNDSYRGAYRRIPQKTYLYSR